MMASYSTEDIRNIALVGHSGSGKTTLIESMLHRSGAISSAGSIEKGNTVSDFDAQEKAYKHSLNSTVVSMDYHGGHINLIDTPGYPDFMGRALAVLPAVETCAVVINAQTGIEMITRRMMDIAKDRGLDRLIIVNKIDAEQVDLDKLMIQIKETFGSECLPINLPTENNQKVVDCFFSPSGDETDFSSVSEAHTQIVDQVVELDEVLMEIYLEQGQEISPEQLHDPFEQSLREGHLVPVCFVSAKTGAGLNELLEIFTRLMPNPNEGNPPQFLKGEGDDSVPIEVIPDAGKHVLAHVFKINVDPFVGKLAIFRIHQGTINKDSQLFIGDGRKPFKVGHLFKLQGKEHTEVVSGMPGDICAVNKVDDVHFDAVLHDSHDEDHIHLRSLNFPPPMYGLAIEVKSRGDEQKISDTLHKIIEEDPSLIIEHHANMNETVMRGIGELHLRVILDKLKDQYHIDVKTRPPRIAYRETITSRAEGHHRHKKQTGGAGQFGEVSLKVQPLPRGGGFEFVDKIAGGVIPRQFMPAVEKGIQKVLDEGVISGYPLQDIQVTIVDGKHHAVDSKEVAFVAAGKKAFIDAILKSKPVVLEPVVNITITAPSNAMGDITADLSGKRGRISRTEAMVGGFTLISGTVPLSELDNYQSRLKSFTGGTGSFSVEFSHYHQVQSKIQKELVAAYRPKQEED
jgi:elongation factor G